MMAQVSARIPASHVAADKIEKCSKESCSTTMMEFIARHPQGKLDDVINFLFRGLYNSELMTGVLAKPAAVWGPFHPVAEYGTPPKGPSRLFIATHSTGNKRREDGKATIPHQNIVLEVNNLLTRIHTDTKVKLEVVDNDFVNGRVFLVIEGKEFAEQNVGPVLSSTVQKLQPLLDFLNTHQGKIAVEAK